MRLSEAEVGAILTCAKRTFGQGCVVRLFGSRLDDCRRGGDIDLHVVTETSGLATIQNEILFSLALQDAIGEQKIDVIARAPGFLPRPIDEIALTTGSVIE